MKAARFALMFATMLSIASIARAISVVLVTDDAGMSVLADSDDDALIRGTVSSVKSIPDGGRTPSVEVHFAGVKNDYVYAAITDPTPWQYLYGEDLSGLVGKTIEMVSKAIDRNGKIYFATASEFRVIESGSGSPEAASNDYGDAATIAKLESLGNDGNMLAREELGAIYFTGYGTIARDYKKSVFWLQKSVDQNHSMMANAFLARMYEYGWGVDQDSVLASGYYQDIEFSEGNAILKKAIAAEWIKVQNEKHALSGFNNHEEYVDAESRLRPARHSASAPGVPYMKVTISAKVIAALIFLSPGSKSQPCVNAPRLEERPIFDSASGQWLYPVTWVCE
jgi:hypothetical protein